MKETTMTDALANATAAINADPQRNFEPSSAEEAAQQISAAAQAVANAVDPQPPAPYVYKTETTEMARTFINQIDRLSRLVHEDDQEIEYNEKERDRQIHELQMRFEEEQDAILNNSRQANEIAMARRADRVDARSAIQKVIDELRGKS